MGAELRYAVKALLRMPVLAAVVIGSLAIGIGANTVVFSWVQLLALSPIPGVRDVGGLRELETRTASGGHPGMSWQEFKDLRGALPSFPEPFAAQMVPFNLGEPGRVERASGMLVSANYFSALGLTPAQGRFFLPEEGEVAGGAPVVVVSDDFWRNQLGGRDQVVGKVLELNGRPVTIIGVAPPKFQGTITGLNLALFVPATMAPVLFPGSNQLTERAFRGYSVLARLAKGANAAAGQQELDRMMQGLERDYPSSNKGVSGEVLALSDAPRGPQRFMLRAVELLQAIMLVLLLAVCGNTANLLLARASSRRREIGVRLALGSGSWRVARLLLLENLLLGLLGAAGGAALAVWGTQAIRAVPVIAAFPIKFQTSINLGGLGFAMLLGVVCGLLCAAAPTLQLVHTIPQDALRSGSASAPRRGMRNLLMGTEVALATIVLVAAGAFWRGFQDTRDADPGFKREGLLLAAYDLTGGPTDSVRARTFTRDLLAKLRTIPGASSAALATSVPLDLHGLPARSFTLEGRARNDATPEEAIANLVSPGYFATMGIPLLQGSDFVDLDDRSSGPQVIVNQAFVQRFLEGREPLGRKLEAGGKAYLIAGVVATTTYDAFGEPPTPALYFSLRDRPQLRGEIHLRAAGGNETALGLEIRRVVRELDPMLPVFDVRTLNQHVERNLFLKRIPARMFVVLGPLILALAAIGIYAVVAYAVAQRTTEIGIRLALGATSARIQSQVIWESLQVIGFGIAAGAIVALAVGTGLGGSPAVLLGAPLLTLGVAVLSCWLPARRASRIDALEALRSD